MLTHGAITTKERVGHEKGDLPLKVRNVPLGLPSLVMRQRIEDHRAFGLIVYLHGNEIVIGSGACVEPIDCMEPAIGIEPTTCGLRN
jgi:hypothetical protein